MLPIQNLRPGEKIIMVVKVHWITYIILKLYFLGTIILSLTLAYFGPLEIKILLILIVWMISLVILYIQWLNYELDMFVITNNRIIGVEQIGFLNRRTTNTNLEKVQEVTSKTKGFLAVLFNFGEISIQTAGNLTTLDMNYVPDAMQTARQISNIIAEYKHSHNIKNDNNI